MQPDQIDKAWRVASKCEQCAIRSLVLFADLTKEDFDLLHYPIHELNFATGETLYNQGDKPEAIYTVRSGLVKLVSYLSDGSFRIVRILRQGDVVGLEALDNKNYLHHAVILESASFCRLPVGEIKELNDNSPHLFKQLTARWQRVISDADTWLSKLTSGFAKQRVAHLLIYLSQDCQSTQCYLPGREDMGALLAITTETASRVIAEFKRKGFIKLVSPHQAIIDQEALVAIIQGDEEDPSAQNQR
ncbi:MAG: Crp/Fnr family transcriptional regulator [Gammaproteobacteria bacterium]|nr:MAG: Crp/Fnr family transcriptional regulator [Gammaproteobacteria bacterium]RLA22990.1 MAG: Crp/Fnr family transcriptional regulator [Gammaproteobacteria bacterium]